MSAPVVRGPQDADPGWEDCANEPIHVPGAVQPHGWLLGVDARDGTIRHVSANLLDIAPGAVPGAPLTAALPPEAVTTLRHHVEVFTDLRARNPVHLELPTPQGDVVVDAVLHRPEGRDDALVVVELEPAEGVRPFSFPNTYQAVRDAVAELNRTAELGDLYRVTVRVVRELTGFDRVMLYRFDPDWNGEVVAEARREDLEPFLGLHYPATDIPEQARRLYERNWLRAIPDVRYRPVPLLATRDDDVLDLSLSTLRSVSPVHLEYLSNMGVEASMSVSLLKDDRLWGLVACHHYSGPHLPPYGVRAAAEFLGSALSLRLVDREREERLARALAGEKVLVEVAQRLADHRRDVADVLVVDDALAGLVPADGVAVVAEGRLATRGRTPADDVLTTLVRRLRTEDREVVHAQAAADEPAFAGLEDVTGALAAVLPDGQAIVWFRDEQRRRVDWAGDPGEKVVVTEASGRRRLGPRESFAQWTQVVADRSLPWEAEQVDAALRLRALVLETLYARARREMQAAEVLQESLLLQSLPRPQGWTAQATYVPAAGGRVGGDWYDAVELPDGRCCYVVGDVAGHGLDAASAMAQLRMAVRAFLALGQEPADAVRSLDTLVQRLLPDQMATLLLLTVRPGTGRCELLSVGHPAPVRAPAGGAGTVVPVDPSPPLGLGLAEPAVQEVDLAAGECLVLFTDGLVERRGAGLDDGIARLCQAVARTRDTRTLVDQAAPGGGADDVTVLRVSRDD